MFHAVPLLNCHPDYVLQRALTVADQDQKDALVELIKPHLSSSGKPSHHGRHLVASKSDDIAAQTSTYSAIH